jgi:hypothetical protein
MPSRPGVGAYGTEAEPKDLQAGGPEDVASAIKTKSMKYASKG